MKKAFLLLLPVLLLGAGCTATTAVSTTNTTPTTPAANTETAVPNPMMQPQTPPDLTESQKTEIAEGSADHEAKALTFDVTGGNFYFVPNSITVKKGDTVTINFMNAGGFHDWTLDEFGVKIAGVQTGATGSATFVADKTGTFEYYCSVGKHRALGQKGTITVKE